MNQRSWETQKRDGHWVIAQRIEGMGIVSGALILENVSEKLARMITARINEAYRLGLGEMAIEVIKDAQRKCNHLRYSDHSCAEMSCSNYHGKKI